MWSHCHRLTLYKAKGVSIQHIGKRIARDDPGWCIILGFCYISDDQWKGVSCTSRSSSALMSIEIRCSKKQKVIRKVVKSPLMFCDHVWSACIHIFHLSGHPGTSSTWALQDSQGVCTGPCWRPTAHGKLRQCSRTDRRSGLEAPEGTGKTVLVYSKVRYPIVSTDDLVLDIISYHVFFSHTVIPLSICGKTLKALTGKLHIAGTLWVHTFRTRLHCHRILWNLYWWWSPGESSRNAAEITSVRCFFLTCHWVVLKNF